MSDLKRPFKHFDTEALFLEKKISANSSNSAYTINNGVIQSGTPDILWQDFVLIHDIGQIWNRGRFYNYQKSYNSLAKYAKNTFEPYHGAMVSFLDENGRSYLIDSGIIDVYKSHNKLPSISIVPEFIESKEGLNPNGTIYPVMSIDQLNKLIDLGCDIVNGSYSADLDIYSKNPAYSTVVEDLKHAEDWFVRHNIFTNCISYPQAIETEVNELIKIAASRFEEYGLVWADQTTCQNNYKTDNRSLVKLYLNDNNVGFVKSQIDAAILNNSWIIITTHSCGASSAEDFGSEGLYGKISASTIENVLNYIESKGNIRYYNITDALNVRGSELNIDGTKIYKDGDIEFNAKAINTLNKHIDDYLFGVQGIVTDTGLYLTSENGDVIIIDDINVNVAHSTLSFNSMSDKFKSDLLDYIKSHL